MGISEGKRFGALAIALSATSAFVIGAAASWWAFGAPRAVDLVADNGNTADWVAAIFTTVAAVATCVIGYAANSYTKAQAVAASQKERLQNSVSIRTIEIRVALLMRPKVAFRQQIQERDRGRPLTIGSLTHLVCFQRDWIKSLLWNDPAWSILREADLHKRIDAEQAAQEFVFRSDRYLGSAGDLDSVEEFDADNVLLRELIESANRLAMKAAALSVVAKRLRGDQSATGSAVG